VIERKLFALVLLATACGSGPTEPKCTNFFGSLSYVELNLFDGTGSAGPCPSRDFPGQGVTQTGCEFRSSGLFPGTAALLSGTFGSGNSVTVTVSGYWLTQGIGTGDCSLSGTGTVSPSGKMITGTLDSAPADICCSPGAHSAHFAFTITKP
jgi:hypothetical protein